MGVLLAGALVGVAGCGASEDSGTPAPETTTSPAAEETTTSPAATPEETTEAPTEATEEESASEEPAAAAEVTVINNDSASHTVTSDEEGMFDSVFGPNETVTFTAPDEPGDYSFICTYHPAMVGTLVVEG